MKLALCFLDDQGIKILAVEPSIYKYLMEKKELKNSEDRASLSALSEIINISKLMQFNNKFHFYCFNVY